LSAREARPGAQLLSPEELARAARLLEVRSRRDASSPFTGGYRSAFRGGGVEFEESRPYVAGDDVRAIDWNATARTGEPWVKRFREERDQTLLVALDVSASMGFGPPGRSKSAVAVRVAALLAVAAGRAGDRIGLVGFDTDVRFEIAPERGEAHTWRVIQAAVAAAPRPGAGTDVAAALRRACLRVRRRAVVFVLSDFRDAGWAGESPARLGELAALARRHEIVAAILHDPREEELPRAGRVRLDDPERPGRALVIDTGDAGARARYRAACAARRRALELGLRSRRIDVLWLHTGRDPLRALVRFFGARAGRLREAAA
jgi:uncharacterized protein (DUF58 family)